VNDRATLPAVVATAATQGMDALEGTAPHGGGSRLMLSLLRPYGRWIVIGALLGFLAVGSAVGLLAASAWLISRAAIVSNVAEVALAITAVRVLAIARAAFRYLERFVTHRASLQILAGLRVWFYRAIEPLAPAALDRRHSGDLLARIVRDVDSLEDLYVRVAVPPIVAALVAILTAVLLGAFEPLLGVVAVIGLAIAGAVIPLVTRRLARVASIQAISARAAVDTTVIDVARGIADLIAFDATERQLQRLRGLGQEHDASLERIALHRGLGAGLGGLVASLTGLAVLVVAIPLVSSGQLDGVYLALVVLAAIAAFEAVLPLGQSIQQLDASRAAAARLGDLVDATPEVIDSAEPLALPDGHDLVVRGLRYRYGPDEPEALAGLDLEVPAGDTLALVGPSGAGKSTLVSLLLRFREYAEGTIRLGGRELRSIAADEVRASIALVPQRIHLFDATIRDNLSLADDELSEERMRWACAIACIDTVIEALPEGYDTRIGEDGVRLSGGERQRIAIARAILRDAPILILDEATSDLDESTERRVLDALQPVIRDRTTIFVTHRTSVASRADRVVELEIPAD
jgi:thiol reductant ABC exporter CydC subunit